MEKLSDFKPLQRVDLPELGEIKCSGLILIVGPNSGGKTQLLRDIYRRLKGDAGRFVVARDIALRKVIDFERFLSCLEHEGYAERFKDEGNNKQIRLKSTFVGSGDSAPLILEDHAMAWHSSYARDESISGQQRWLSIFGRLLVTALFLDRRLVAVNQTNLIDFETAPPQNDLHALHMNDNAKQRLQEELLNTFGHTVWLDTSRGNGLCIRVSDRRDCPTAEDCLSPAKMMAYRTIESEGDGLKSYVATCIALLLGRRPVCLIDEPEMCLHPPQAYNLGRCIAKFGSSPETVTFVATHSSYVLRGVIDATPSCLQILRLTRVSETFAAHLVDSTKLASALKKPAAKAESVLDGIFAQAVVVVEADTDRAVYQATFERLQDEIQLDAHFATVGGLGGISNTCYLYRTLRIPVAVIADLDLIADGARLTQVLESLAVDTDKSKIRILLKRVMKAGAEIKQITPPITANDVQDRLKDILSTKMNWSQGDDITATKKLREIANDLDRIKQLKRIGIAGLPSTLQTELYAILQELANYGLFLVPVGELEQWFLEGEVLVSKHDKSAWANEAASYVRNLKPQGAGIWKFVRQVAAFLVADKHQIHKDARDPSATSALAASG